MCNQKVDHFELILFVVVVVMGCEKKLSEMKSSFDKPFCRRFYIFTSGKIKVQYTHYNMQFFPRTLHHIKKN